MKFNDLSIDKIEEALNFLDYEDREVWYLSAFAIKSELGESGFELWNRWSSQGSSYKLSSAKSTWSTSTSGGGVTIGSLIFMAMQRGFKLGEYRPISSHVKKEREARRIEAEKKAAIEEKAKKERQAQKALTAKDFFEKAEPCVSHEYLEKKDVSPYSNVRIADWTYRDDHGAQKIERDALIIPLMTFENGIVSLQAIFADGTKKMMGGAQKSGTFHIIGDETDTILITEGFATAVTVYEATGFMTFAAIDSGNLIKVAKSVREKFKRSKIIICADNDQYKKSNVGIKSAEKTACEVDADIVYPIFRCVDTKPTDFNDLANLEGIDEVKKYFESDRLYFAKSESDFNLNSFDLDWIEDAKKVFHESDSDIDIARAAKVLALESAKKFPAFMTMEEIRASFAHKRLSIDTHLSIMKQVQWSIFNRKRVALSSIKPESWGNRHDHIVVTDLENLDLSANVSVVFAPMGSGKTQKVIKPFSERKNFMAVAHRRSLISELSKTLGVKSYEKVSTESDAFLSDSLAVCLPSTKSLVLKPFVDRVCNLAIDEISQNIRFTSSKECKVIGANQDSVFTGLQDLILESDKVLVCDASIDKMTLDFLEASRPDEKFTIFEKVPTNLDKKAFLYREKDEFLTKIQLELEAGGKVWLAVESADKAEILAQIFKCEKTMLITSKTSKTIKVKAFLDDIKTESLKYDLVIASPSISSGVSVEHEVPHFTMVAGMASGHSVCFSDFAQMLGRVRYVNEYHIHLMPNSLKNNGLSDLSIITGLRQAAAIEGAQWRENAFTSFKSHIEAKEDAYKSDFANGLVWFLTYFCFKVEFAHILDADISLGLMLKELADDKKEAYRNSIKNARKISKIEAEELKKEKALTDEEIFSLKAFSIKNAFKIDLSDELTDQDIDFYEDYASVRRFGYLSGFSKKHDDSELNISLRGFERAKIQMAQKMFDGIDFNFITDEDCDRVVTFASKNENRFILSSLGLVPKAYGQWCEDKSGKLKDYQLPKIKTKSMAAILEKFGMKWKRSNSRSHGNIYRVDSEQINLLKKYSNGIFS